MKEYRSRSFIWRGALGGAVGISLLFIIRLLFNNPYEDFLIVPDVPLILGFGALLGAGVGVIIFAFKKIIGVDLGLIPRSFFGVLITALVAWLYLYTKHEPDFAGNLSPQSQIIFRSLVFGVAAGLLPGIFAGRVSRHRGAASSE